MRALVTGSARGIGRAIADALTATGAHVIGCDVQPDGDQPCVDVSDAGHVRRLVERAGDIDVLINNAAIARRTTPTDPWEHAADDFDAVVGTNLRGAFLVGRAVIPGMVARRAGHIINVTSDRSHASMDVYDATKSGLAGLTRSWAAALGPFGIRVNSLSVAATDTPMLRDFLGHEPAPELVASWLRPSQVADAVVMLLDEGPYGRTGEDISVKG